MYATGLVPAFLVTLSAWHVVVGSNPSINFNASTLNGSTSIKSCNAPWHYVDQDGKCKCASLTGTTPTRLIKCTDEGTLLRIGYCTTYTYGEGLAMSRCPYLKMKMHATYAIALNAPQYIVLPSNISELNDYMCGSMKRKGFLCSECIDGFSPSFTSPDYMACSNCTASKYFGVPLFILIEIVPITLFYLVFLLLQINITSSPMTCYIFYSQVMMIAVATPSAKSQLLEMDTG